MEINVFVFSSLQKFCQTWTNLCQLRRRVKPCFLYYSSNSHFQSHLNFPHGENFVNTQNTVVIYALFLFAKPFGALPADASVSTSFHCFSCFLYTKIVEVLFVRVPIVVPPSSFSFFPASIKNEQRKEFRFPFEDSDTKCRRDFILPYYRWELFFLFAFPRVENNDRMYFSNDVIFLSASRNNVAGTKENLLFLFWCLFSR